MNESQEVSPFPAGDHNAHINRRPQRHSKHKPEKNIKDPQKKYRLGTSVKYFTGGLKPLLLISFYKDFRNREKSFFRIKCGCHGTSKKTVNITVILQCILTPKIVDPD